MAKKHRSLHVGINFYNTTPLQEQLIREIINLERQREQIKLNQVSIDFSMMQTYKEMIHCRKEMLAELPKSP